MKLRALCACAATIACAAPLSLFAQDGGANSPTQVAQQPTVQQPTVPQLAQQPATTRLPETTVEATPFPGTTGRETVVTPTRTDTPLSTVGSSVTVITREQIIARGQPNVYDVLRNQLGIDVANAGGPGRQTAVFMRGAGSAQTKVLVDGIPVNDPSNPSRAFDFGSLSIDNIERIEILRGPQSTLYGSDAIGGVINIITLRGEGPPRARVSVSGGAFDTTEQQFSSSGGNENAYYSIGGGYQDSEGYSAQNFGDERDGYHIGNLSARAGWTPSDNFEIDNVVRYTHANVDIDGFLVDDPLARNINDQLFWRTQFRTLWLDGMIEQKLGLNWVHYERADPTAVFSPTDFDGDTLRLDWQNNIAVTDTNLFTVGIDAQEEFATTNLSSEESLTNTGVYLQDQFSFFNRAFFTVGGRFDEYSQAGPANTYRATGRYWHYETGTSVKGSIGTGFRAPTISDLITGFGANPNLLPEESKGWDYGIEQYFADGDLMLGVTYFRNDFTNLIQFDPIDFVLFNTGLARATGVEVSTVAQLDAQTVASFYYTHTDPIDLTNDVPLLRRPQDKYLFNLTRSFYANQGSLGMTVIYVGEREDVGRVELASYTTVGLAGRWQLNNYWSCFARIDNLFGEKYEEIATYNVPGCTFYGGVALGQW